MQELRLMGVHEDGDHLLFGDDAGAMYKVRIDETLRVATQRVPRRQARQTPPVKVPLSPREIQARIRAGASAEQIAVESGYDLDHIRRYETPVRAERDWLAGLARQVEVASPSHHDDYRSVFGDRPATLEAMVAARLRALSVDPATVQWDAWRRQDGAWDIVARFELPEESAIDLGEQPPARWVFDPSRKHLANANRWAQVLSELEPLGGPIPSRRLAAVTDAVFDVESEPEVEDESADLLDVLRSRRGQRLGSDEESDDALALLLSQGPVPAAHPRTGRDADQDAAESGGHDGDGGHHPAASIDEDGQRLPDDSAEGDGPDEDAGPAAARGREGHRWGSGRSRLRGRGRRGDAAEDVSVEDLLGFEAAGERGDAADAGDTGTGRAVNDGEPADVTSVDGTAQSGSGESAGNQSGSDQSSSGRSGSDAGDRVPDTDDASVTAAGDQPEKKSRPESDQGGKAKARRSSVPSWDEIVFGKRGD